MSELVDIRTALVALITGIPEIASVSAYERADIGTNQLPAASIYLAHVSPPPHSQAELVRFGTGDFQADWHINIRLTPVQPGYEVASQQIFETLHKRLHAVVAPTGQLLSDSTNTTFVSLLTSGEFVIPADATGTFMAVFGITTITLT